MIMRKVDFISQRFCGIVLLLLGILVCACYSTANAAPGDPAIGKQRYQLSFEVVFDSAKLASGEVMVYIPFPRDSDEQTVESYAMGSDMPPEKLLSFELRRDNIYGNRTIVARVLEPAPGEKLHVDFTVTRRENSNPPAGAPPRALVFPPSGRFLKRDRLVPVDGRIKEAAAELLAGVEPRTHPDEAVAALYRGILAKIKFDAKAHSEDLKADQQDEQGDALSTLSRGSGDRYDFASLLSGLARAAGFPARVDVGYIVPLGESTSDVTGIAKPWAWTSVFLPKRGWVPLDAAAAAQTSRLADYYLGHVGSDHVVLGAGRDLELGQNGEPRNFFGVPFAQVANAKSDVLVPLKSSLHFTRIVS